MHIAFVTVGYRELRSGAEFSNRSYEVCYTAGVSQGENPDNVRAALTAKAQSDVAKFFAGKALAPGPHVDLPETTMAEMLCACTELCEHLSDAPVLSEQTASLLTTAEKSIEAAREAVMPF